VTEGIPSAAILALGSRGAVPSLGEASTAFEEYLLGELMRQASQPLVRDSLLDGGSAGRMYRELLHQEFARIAASRGTFGLAKMIEQQSGATDTEHGGQGETL